MIPTDSSCPDFQHLFQVLGILAEMLLPIDEGFAVTMNIIYGAAAPGPGTCRVWGDSAPYAGAIRDILHVPED